MVAREEGKVKASFGPDYIVVARSLAGWLDRERRVSGCLLSHARSLAATREMQGRAREQVAGTGGGGEGMEREWSGRARGEWEAGSGGI
jgi:hypothetical protein